MKIEWNEEKNELLKETRNVSFEEVLEEISKGSFIGPEENPARKEQKRIIVKLNNYPLHVAILSLFPL